MDQTKIWDHFQNNEETKEAFANAVPRYIFIAHQIRKRMSVLNIGVGRGGLEKNLLKKGVMVNCLDPSQKTIEWLRQKYDLGDRARVGFSQSIPFPNSHFDVVVMSEVLEHLSDEVLSSTLNEVRRVLKPRGRFIGTVPANEALLNNQTVCPHCGEKFHRWGHQQSFTLTRLRDLLLKYNFKVLRNETRAFPDWHRNGLKNYIKNVIRYLLGRAGAPIASPNIYFEARR